jgi:hypothetical protein
MPSGTFKLRNTNKVDEWGNPRQSTIRNLEIGEQVEGRHEYKDYEDDDEMPFLVIETSDGKDIGEIEPLDADYYVRRANAGDIVLMFIDELKENKRTSNLDVYVRLESYLPKEARKKFPGVFDDYNEFTRKRPPIKTKLRGVMFDSPDGLSRQDIIKTYVKKGEQLLIAHDQENQQDPKAIGAYTMLDGYLVGYLSKDLSASILPAIKNNQMVECEVLDVTGIDDPDKSLGVNIQLNVLTKQETIEQAQRSAAKYQPIFPTNNNQSIIQETPQATPIPETPPPAVTLPTVQPLIPSAPPVAIQPAQQPPQPPQPPQSPEQTWNTYAGYQPYHQPLQKLTIKQRWRTLPKKARTWIIVILAIIAIYLISLLTGCSPKTIETVITKEVEVTRQVGVIQTVIITATPIPPTETPVLTNTPELTIKPPTPTAATNPESIAKNVAMTQEQNGVEVILERVLIADPNSEVGLKHRDDEYLKNKSVYLQPIIKITNNTDRLIKMFFVGDIIVQANDEQISYNNFINIFYMPEYSKDVLPGATVRGPVWVGMNRHKWNQITKVVVRIPHFESNEIKITEDFIFEVEVGDWGFEPLPDHLKN